MLAPVAMAVGRGDFYRDAQDEWDGAGFWSKQSVVREKQKNARGWAGVCFGWIVSGRDGM